MTNKEHWINNLELIPHPEGGYFKETYRSNVSINLKDIGLKQNSSRNLATGIYFLIDKGNFSAFHKIKSDEMWHFYAGDSLLIHMIDEEGNYFTQTLGRNLEEGEKLQFVVPAHVWFASEVQAEGNYSLVGCTVSFGFDFRDFELADQNLMSKFPKHKNVIQRLIR